MNPLATRYLHGEITRGSSCRLTSARSRGWETVLKLFGGLHAAAYETCRQVFGSQARAALWRLYCSPLTQLVRRSPGALSGQRAAETRAHGRAGRTPRRPDPGRALRGSLSRTSCSRAAVPGPLRGSWGAVQGTSRPHHPAAPGPGRGDYRRRLRGASARRRGGKGINVLAPLAPAPGWIGSETGINEPGDHRSGIGAEGREKESDLRQLPAQSPLPPGIRERRLGRGAQDSACPAPSARRHRARHPATAPGSAAAPAAAPAAPRGAAHRP